MERRFRITVNGKQYEVTVEELTEGSTRILPQPGDMQVPDPGTRNVTAPTVQTGAGTTNTGPNDLVSPLAGVVVSLTVKAGERVTQGDGVAVIEAMKMKTTVVAHRDGTVLDIDVKEGDAVDAGQTIMVID